MGVDRSYAERIQVELSERGMSARQLAAEVRKRLGERKRGASNAGILNLTRGEIARPRTEIMAWHERADD